MFENARNHFDLALAKRLVFAYARCAVIVIR